MLRRIIALATTTFIALTGIAMTAEAAPFNIGDAAKAKNGTELVQVRGGRGGGGMRGGGRHFGGRHFGGGHRFAGRHFGHRPHRPGCRAAWCRPHHGHGHHWKKKKIILIGGGYHAEPDCSTYWHRWQATGSYHWKGKYYACVGY